MTLGEKIKNLRTRNNLTQEELADRLFVTRTAVSKWETNRGYPDIANLKSIAELFGVSLDDLVSDEDVRCSRLLDEKRAKRFYCAAVVFFAITVLFAVLAFALGEKFLMIGALLSVVLFAGAGLMAKPAYKRRQSRENLPAYVVSRVVLLAVFACVLAGTIIQLAG